MSVLEIFASPSRLEVGFFTEYAGLFSEYLFSEYGKTIILVAIGRCNLIVYACMHTHIHTHMQTHTHAYVYAHKHMHIHTYPHTCINTHIQNHICGNGQVGVCVVEKSAASINDNNLRDNGVWSIYIAKCSASQVSALNNSVDVRHVPSSVEKDDGVCVCVCVHVCV